MNDLRFEICIDSVAGAIAAQEAGAHRVELCQALSVGGTTPSAAMIQSVKAASNFPVHVLIRPRGGDFVFCDDEWDVMARDIELAGEWGVDGVVIGGLCADRTLDVEHCRRLIERARPMSVTFHRAFDLCADPMTALRQLLDLRVDRLLTSGQAATAHEGRGFLRDLVRAAGERLLIMAGAGIRGGMSYGETNEFGNEAVIDVLTIHDVHAIILDRLGIDHERLTFRHGGRDQRLTDVHGHVPPEILA